MEKRVPFIAPHRPTNLHITALIPAYNEEEAIGQVLDELQSIRVNERPLCSEIIVVDNNSTDKTASIAYRRGATVVQERRPGYGAACLAGIKAIGETDIVLFVDGDCSNTATDILSVCSAVSGGVDLVIGSRTLGVIEKNSMTKIQRAGNALVCLLIRLRFNIGITDLGPLRAIRHDALRRLDMNDQRFGWTAEMQIKAGKHGLHVMEVPVSVRPRIGKSKISGTWRGMTLAGYDLLGQIFTR